MTSLEVKTEMMKHNVKQWQLAEAIGVSDMTLTRWLRKEELDDGTSEVLMNAINDIGSDNCKDVQLVSRNGNRSLLLVNLENIDYELSEIGDELFRIRNILEIMALSQLLNDTKFDWSGDGASDSEYKAICHKIYGFYEEIAARGEE